MNLKEIKEIAQQKGIKAGKMKKEDLIHSIQRVEGNFACYRTASSGECVQFDCLWRKDCLA